MASLSGKREVQWKLQNRASSNLVKSSRSWNSQKLTLFYLQGGDHGGWEGVWGGTFDQGQGKWEGKRGILGKTSKLLGGAYDGRVLAVAGLPGDPERYLLQMLFY